MNLFNKKTEEELDKELLEEESKYQEVVAKDETQTRIKDKKRRIAELKQKRFKSSMTGKGLKLAKNLSVGFLDAVGNAADNMADYNEKMAKKEKKKK